MKYTTCLLKRYGKVLFVCLAVAVGAAVMLGSTCSVLNKAPTVPVISGPSAGVVGVPVTFKATATDPESDSIAFQFDWGDSSTLAWTNLIASGETTSVQHTYADSGFFSVKAKAKDKQGKESGWSSAYPLGIAAVGSGYPDSLLTLVQISGCEAITASPGGEFVYAARPNRNDVLVLQVSDYSLHDSIRVGDWPSDLVVSPGGERLYVSNLAANSVSVVGIPGDTVVQSVAVGRSPGALALSDDGQYLYVVCTRDNNVWVLRTSDMTVLRTVAVGKAPGTMAVVSQAVSAYVANNGDSTVSVISLPDQRVISSVVVASGVKGLAAAPDGRYVYVSSIDSMFRLDVASVRVDAAAGGVWGTPASLVVTRDNSYVIAGTFVNKGLCVFLADPLIWVGGVQVGAEPGHICMSPDGQRIYVSDKIRGVYVIVPR